MPKKQAEPDTPDPVDSQESPPDIRADLAPIVPPQFDSAMEDPEHPLHYHCKRDSLESPPTPKD